LAGGLLLTVLFISSIASPKSWLIQPASLALVTSPQATFSGQWMIEFEAGKEKPHLTLNYRSEGNEWHSNNSFDIEQSRLQGLTQAQVMSGGANVRFQIQRDAGTLT
jgi:hypothetical protein